MEPRSPSPPSSIGRFRVDAVLGSGGMGSVYKAFDPTLQRTVAIKTVRPDIDRPEFIERLIREAQACARLRHPNVVTVYEAGQIDGLVYIVMEYLEGTDLGVALKRGDLTFEAKIKILIQILDALEHTHGEDVIHRDIKPSNVHRQPDGSIKVVDFGLARMVESSPLTQSGGVMCTPDYASPEQLKGEHVDKRTDIYSTGALAYEMFAGRRPFQSDSDHDSVGAMILRVMSDPPRPIDVAWTRKFPEFERIITRAMAKPPAGRYQSAEDMRNALTAFLASSRDAIAATQAELDAFGQRTVIEAETMIASGMAVTRPVLQSPAPNPTVPFSQAPTEAPAYSSRAVWWMGGAAAAAVLVIAGVVTFSPTTSSIVPSTSGAIEPQPTAATTVTRLNPPQSPDSTRAVQKGDATNSDPLREVQPTAGDGAVARVASADTSGTSNPGGIVAAAHEASAKELFRAKPDAGGAGVNAGLRFRLIRLTADNTEEDVDAAATFHSGDRIRFAFDSNIDGYLYVVQQGSSGRWTVLFPSARINGGRNAIKRTEQYQVPSSSGWFRLDATAGTENVFVFLSREPMNQLPGFDRPVTGQPDVADSVVDDLRNRIKSRDLVFEKDESAGESGAQVQATYVVNRAEVGQAVAASITLTHQ